MDEIAALSNGSSSSTVCAVGILGHSYKERGVEFRKGTGDGGSDAKAFLPSKGNFNQSPAQLSCRFEVSHVA